MDAEKLLKEKRLAIIALACKHGAQSVRVFGSVARGDSGPESDVDLLVKMEEGRNEGGTGKVVSISVRIGELRDLVNLTSGRQGAMVLQRL